MSNSAEEQPQTWVSRLLAARALILATVFVLTASLLQSAEAQTFNIVHNFEGGDDGANPVAGLSLDRAGSLYGTTMVGGGAGLGSVFRLVPSGHNWRFYTLYSFDGLDNPTDGIAPYAGVVIGADGFLYGTTHAGGDGQGCMQWYLGCGTVFRVKPGKTIGAWEETVLYPFGTYDGSNPDHGDVVFDQAGNLYGTTRNGGAHLQGAVYELTPNGGGWTEKIVYSFGGTPDGASPLSGPVLDQAGNLYGTTSAGGTNGWGTVYRLTPSGPGWTEDVLYSFRNGSDGATPIGGVILAGSGNLYGTTQSGGNGGGGTVFELSRLSGNSWGLSALYDLLGPASGGPYSSVVMDSAGNLYGTTSQGGPYHWGSVFKLTWSNGEWTFTSLHDFTGGSDGGFPTSNVTIAPNGKLYGTAQSGGAYGAGAVWEITP